MLILRTSSDHTAILSIPLYYTMILLMLFIFIHHNKNTDKAILFDEFSLQVKGQDI